MAGPEQLLIGLEYGRQLRHLVDPENGKRTTCAACVLLQGRERSRERMDQLFFATVKDVKFTPKDGETKYVVQLLARLEPADLTKLALFGDRILQVHLHVNEAAESRNGHQAGLFDPEVAIKPFGDDGRLAWHCANCGAPMLSLTCEECGQHHREPAATPPEQPAPATCTAGAVYAIRYQAGDGCRGTLFACAEEDHIKAVTAMAIEYADPGESMGIVHEPEEIGESDRGKIVCSFVGQAVEEELAAALQPVLQDTCVCGHSLEQHGEPGSYCRGAHDCACMFFESAAEAADRMANPDADAAEHAAEMASAAEDLEQEMAEAAVAEGQG